MISEILLFLSSCILGIFLGAQIAEAMLFVPYWKKLSADDFFELHKTYGKKIYQFFSPLTIVSTFIPLITVGYHIIHSDENQLLFGLMGFSTVAFFSTYFMFFKNSNKSFAERSLSNDELPLELIRWENWHWGRICFEFIAFGCSLLLLIKS
ncbi:hypothetical protein [Lutimonas sp.]|uniref:hypothetical protein n=1 Tax=Lutimonas sp. TaxID=1872403 RepID=UPI003D9B7CD2